MRPAAALAARLGVRVREPGLLDQALVHSSYLHEHRDLASGHNERLEFLGDAVVSLAVSEALYLRHPGDDEGMLSARRAAIVSTAGLARLASRIELGEYLFLGEGESLRGGRRRPSLLASAFEALAGALCLDQGYEATRAWIVALAAPELEDRAPIGTLKSPKSRLQELTQRISGERPAYRVVAAVGPDHQKLFRVEVAVDGRVIGTGEGLSRRIAETAAAAEALEELRRPLDDPDAEGMGDDAEPSEAGDAGDEAETAADADWAEPGPIGRSVLSVLPGDLEPAEEAVFEERGSDR